MRNLIMAITAISLSAAVPASAAGTDDDSVRAAALFTAAFKSRCAEHAFDGREKTPDRYELTYRLTSAQPDEPDNHLVLFQFFCDNFAHSGSAVFIGKGDDGAFSIMTFPYPASRYTKDPQDAGKLIVTGIDGFAASDSLINPDFDPETMTMNTSDHVGNEEYFSTWRFVDGAFRFSGDQTWRFRDGKLERTPEETEETEE